ncbi:ABC transporter substrate-binding protein [Massilia sp. TS11]|uniref:substrate-binding periplasmic protein n=1 Tax=Massilia sp. TS11 TaxID=2908003 RepID=UPI001EDC8A74|nr:ABC transporter substrate-binding protein [Massilia sp. TS11]MCG2586053.1 ABC transporter substrate-binding protein [Massilia sp. TS11]
MLRRLLACLLLLPPFALGAPVVELRTSAQLATAPKFISKGRTEVVGLCVDVFRALERIDPGLRFSGDQQWRVTARIEDELERGQLDVACASVRSREREARYQFIDVPIMTARYFLLARADDPVQVNNWADLLALAPNNSMLVVKGFGILGRLREVGLSNIDDGALDNSTNLQKLVAGRARFFIMRSPGIDSLLRETGLEAKVRVLPAMLEQQPLFMMTGRHLAAATQQRLTRAIIRLEQSGELHRILVRWTQER